MKSLCNTDIRLLQQDLKILISWSDENKLLKNIKKCVSFTFTRRTRPFQGLYEIQEEMLARLDSVRDLGMRLLND